MKSRFCLALLIAAFSTIPVANAVVVINELQWDDTGTDDREFVELYNGGVSAVDISGWTVSGRDQVGATNPLATIPGALNSGTTMIAPGGYYVIANAPIVNVNQVVASNFLENDSETVELWSGTFNTSTLVDAVLYESNKGATAASNAGHGVLPAGVVAQVGTGYFGNHGTGADLTGNTTTSVGRFVNGRDTNNNGRDFGVRPSTPGTSNSPGGVMTAYALPNPNSQANGTDMPGVVGHFVNPKVIDPTLVDSNNLNAIPAPPGGGKAWSAWDPSGGGNGVTSQAVFDTTQMSFRVAAYLDTNDLPVQTTTTTSFRGSEVTFYGLGGGDALVNLTDISGAVNVGSGTLPSADTANAFTGLLWLYEKVGVPVGGGAVSEKLYLIDANDGGDASSLGNTPLDWIVLTTIDLSNSASGWYNLGISIDSSGNVVAEFDGQIFNHTTSTNLQSGAFNVGYRENLQSGSDGTPDAIIRQPTFTLANVPESSWIAGVGAALVGLSTVWARRRRAAAAE